MWSSRSSDKQRANNGVVLRLGGSGAPFWELRIFQLKNFDSRDSTTVDGSEILHLTSMKPCK